MHKFYSKLSWPKKSWQQLALIAVMLILSWMIFQLASARWTHPVQTAPLNSVLLAMREHPEIWTRTEADVSILILDMQHNRVAGAAIAPAGIFISSKDGRHYFVADEQNKVAQLLLSFYHKDTNDAFPLAWIPKEPAGKLGLDLNTVLTLMLLLAAAAYAIRLAGGGFQFAKHSTQVTFDDVIGAAEAKAALRDIMAYLKNPQGFTAVGARPPKGVLLSGPPGTGKTQLAKALAGECKVNFIAATGGDFSAMFLGVGSMRVKSLFRKARKHAPCIVFIDEIDGIGRRTSTENGGPSEAEGNRIINQILAEIDGFQAASGVIVIGATNFPDMVDPALLREGRFDRKITVKLPDVGDRAALFRLYAQRLPALGAIDYTQLARLTTGLAPAAIAYIVNHAALIAAREHAAEIPMAYFLEAIEVCRMGEINGSASALTAAERERIAVHEAGHAIVAQVLGVGRVEKVTILPRGGALGVTLVTQKEDKQLHLKSELEHRIQMLLGGRAAEIMSYDDASSGAASDLKEASKIALSMVATLGLSDQGTLFNLEALSAFNIKPNTEQAVAQAEALLATQNAHCFALLKTYAPALQAITAQLLEYETIDGEAVVEAVAAVDISEMRPEGERRGKTSAMRARQNKRILDVPTLTNAPCQID